MRVKQNSESSDRIISLKMLFHCANLQIMSEEEFCHAESVCVEIKMRSYNYTHSQAHLDTLNHTE